MLNRLSVIFHNKVVFYLASRYFTYFIQFITSLIIAAKLGPYYMGIWGFILLILQYFQQIHFGIANSFNVLYVHHRNSEKECNNYIGNSLVLVTLLCLLVVVFYLYYIICGIDSFEKYNAGQYLIWVCVIAILQYYILFFVNLFRVKNQLGLVAFCQSIVVFLNFICVFFFSGEQLIKYLVAGNVIGNLICVILAATSGSIPRYDKVKIEIKYLIEILKKGFFLFLYNSCFYFIIISVRTTISGNYTVEEFGLFTFSFSLAHAILLLLEALSFVVFPKVVGKLSSDNLNEVCTTISFIRTIYITSSHMLIYFAMICFPFLLYFIPKYEMALTSLNLIALSILMSTCSYGYLELLISKNKEKELSVLSIVALVVNCILSCVFVFFLKVDFSYVIIATMLTYCFFTMASIIMSKIVLGKKSFMSVVSEWLPLRLAIPYLLALLVTLFNAEKLVFLPLLIALFCNWQVLNKIKEMIIKLLKKPEMVNLS